MIIVLAVLAENTEWLRLSEMASKRGSKLKTKQPEFDPEQKKHMCSLIC